MAGNVLIEGDNLPVLASMAEASVELIYTDPPYGSGRKSLPYADRRAGWEAEMHPRLIEMHRVLKPSGAIALHIDERGLWPLQGLLAAVFGEGNRFALIAWQASTGGARTLSNVAEFILVYAKSLAAFRRALPKVSYPTKHASQFRNPDGDPLGPWRKEEKGGHARTYRYGIENPATGEFVKPGLLAWYSSPAGMIERFAEQGAIYRYEPENDRLVFVSGAPGNGVLPRYFFADGTLRKKKYLFERNSRACSLKTIISGALDGPGILAREGAKTFRAILGLDPLEFDFVSVKPIAVGKKLIRHLCPENGLVLDPYAGTGTTGHCVLALNKEFGHTRRFFLIEKGGWTKGSVESITAERLRRVISGEWACGPKEALGGSFESASFLAT